MIVNNKSKFGGSCARFSEFSIPDRDSYSFRQSQTAEWSTRCSYEILDCLQSGGLVVLSCLTYRLLERPLLFSRSGFCDDVLSFPCFSYSHVKSYVKAIQDFFSKRGVANGYRYFVCSEYGERTGHPHYHVLNFFTKEAVSLLVGGSISLATCDSFTQIFKDFLASFWPHGMLRWSKSVRSGGLGIFVKNTSAASYVAKYVCKDSGFYSSLLKFLGVDKLTPALRRRYKHSLPRHYQSSRFGFSMLNGITEDELLNGKQIIDIKNGKVYRSPVPQYLIRTMTSTLNRDLMSWEITDFGRHFRILRTLKSVENFLGFIESFRDGSIALSVPYSSSAFQEFSEHVYIASASLFSSEDIAFMSALKFISFRNRDAFSDMFDSNVSFAESAYRFIHNFYSYDYNTVYALNEPQSYDPSISFSELFKSLYEVEESFSYLYSFYRESNAYARHLVDESRKQIKNNLYGEI